MACAEQFISEPIVPVAGSFDPAGMSRGEPGLPQRFTWRGQSYEVAEVIEQSITTGPCRNGADEVYLRRHWYTLRCRTGEVMKVYFERQPRTGARGRNAARWWLYTMSESSDAAANA